MTVDGIDSTTSRAVRVILLGMLLLAGGSCGGCIMADGGFRYHARGTLVADESGRPLAGVTLMLALEDWFQEEDLRWFDENAVVTDASGQFELSCSTGLAWSHTMRSKLLHAGIGGPTNRLDGAGVAGGASPS